LVNTEGTGFYRVRYAPELRAALASRAQVELSPIERYGLIDDTWAAVLAGDLTAVDLLEFVESFNDETDLSVWQRIVGALAGLDRLVDGEAREVLRARIRTLVQPAYDRLGPQSTDGDSDRDRELRGVLFEALGALGNDTAIQARARELFATAQSEGDSEPSLLSAAVRVIAANGDASDFEQFRTKFQQAPTPQEELRFLSALADFGDADLMRQVLEMSVTDEVRTQNAPYLLRRAISNRDQGALAWFFVRDEWAAINDRFPSNSIARMLEGIRSLSTPDIAPNVFEFFETHEVPQGDKILAQHLERLEVNVALRTRDSELLTHHLMHHHSPHHKRD
jgi:puromycin-sensitive aminopeptidase